MPLRIDEQYTLNVWFRGKQFCFPKSADVIRTQDSNCELRGTDNVHEEQIMSKDKYPSIFSPQMANIVFIILQIFFATRAVLKIGEYLTIIPRARMGYESIAHEAEGRIGYWLRAHEGERNNCFSKIQLVGKKNIDTKHLSLVKARL